MRRLLMLSLVVTLTAGPAVADHIGIYNDMQGTDCSATIGAGVPVTLYVVHIAPNGTFASEFKVQNDTGLLVIDARVVDGLVWYGAWSTGISIAYSTGSCIAGSIPIMSLQFLALASPGSCLEMAVVPHPDQGIVVAVACDGLRYPAVGGRFVFNSGTDCPCDEIIATEQSTWGRVKSLYR